jgi:probable rRNA maturation factor
LEENITIINESLNPVPRISWGNIFKLTAQALDKNDLEPVTIIFKSKEDITKINKEYRNKDEATNILSFADLRDIFISPEVIEKEAEKHEMNKEYWLIRLIIHGLLHLEGFNHDTDTKEKRMIKIEDVIMKELGYSRK